MRGISFTDDLHKLEGGWMGKIAGKTSADGLLRGQVSGIFISQKWETAGFVGGPITGSMIGYFNNDANNSWEALSIGASDMMKMDLGTTAGGNIDIDTLSQDIKNLGGSDILIDTVRIIRGISGNGQFITDGGGGIYGSMDMGFYAVHGNASSGIWAGIANGTYSDPTSSDWNFVFANKDDASRYLIADVSGYKWDTNVDGPQALYGEVYGLAFKHADTAEGVKVTALRGSIRGEHYIDVDESQVWKGAAAGEWVEADVLLNEHTMFGDAGLSRLDDFIFKYVIAVRCMWDAHKRRSSGHYHKCA